MQMPVCGDVRMTNPSLGHRKYFAAATATVVITILMVLALRAEGRVWFCACGELRFWIGDPNSSHNSQHLLDPYSLTHLLHGVLFAGLLKLTAPRLAPQWRFVAVAFLEAAWEVWENSPFIIDRYRAATIAVGYSGDSVLNSVGDLACCLGGYLTARRLGWIKSAVLVAVAELILLVAIRDNLTLNVLMLVFPLESVKAWQGR